MAIKVFPQTSQDVVDSSRRGHSAGVGSTAPSRGNDKKS